MDLEEWEILPNDGFFDYHGDGGKRTYASSAAASNRSCSSPKTLFNMNHFMCPTSPTKNSRKVPNDLVPVPINLESPTSAKEKETSKELIRVPSSVIILPEVVKSAQNNGPKEADQDPVSQVFFKKMKKENEFADIILDSPKSCFVPPPLPPPVDTGRFDFEEKIGSDAFTGEAMDIGSPRLKREKEIVTEEVAWEENSGGLNLWKWSLSGIGAICSFGVAAATICIIIIGNHQKNKQHQHNQKLRFQIYTDDKRKQVVQHATKFNEAISAVRGVPITRARITYGGYYDGI